MGHWLFPFANRTEMEEARKAANPAVLKQTLTAFKNEMLNEHTWPQAHTQLKEALSAYILKHYPQTSAPGPSYSKSKVATPPGSPSFQAAPAPANGAGGLSLRVMVAVAFENIKCLCMQICVACNAGY
jgi:hypothetical protein